MGWDAIEHDGDRLHGIRVDWMMLHGMELHGMGYDIIA